MARYAQILNGSVVNVIEAAPGFDPGDGSTIVASATAQIGDTYAAGVFSKSAPLAAVSQINGLTFLDFMSLFTPAEQGAIVSSADAQTRLFCLMAAGAPQIDLTDPRVVAGINYLAKTGLIAPARVAVVLAGAPHG